MITPIFALTTSYPNDNTPPSPSTTSLSTHPIEPNECNPCHHPGSKTSQYTSNGGGHNNHSLHEVLLSPHTKELMTMNHVHKPDIDGIKLINTTEDTPTKTATLERVRIMNTYHPKSVPVSQNGRWVKYLLPA